MAATKAGKVLLNAKWHDMSGSREFSSKKKRGSSPAKHEDGDHRDSEEAGVVKVQETERSKMYTSGEKKNKRRNKGNTTIRVTEVT